MLCYSPLAVARHPNTGDGSEKRSVAHVHCALPPPLPHRLPARSQRRAPAAELTSLAGATGCAGGGPHRARRAHAELQRGAV